MKTSFSRLLVSFAGLCAAAPIGSAQSILLDFETAGQFSANFRGVSILGGTAAQTANGASNDFVKHDRQTATDKGVAYLYDTTPADTTVGTQSVFSTDADLTVSFDLYAAPAASSFAIIFADSTNLGNNIMGFFRVNASGQTDTVDFYRDGTVSSSDLTAGTAVGSTFSQDVGIGVGTAFTSGNGYSATLSIAGTTPTIALSVGDATVSRTFAAGDINWTDTVLILRLYDVGAGVGSGVGIDNFAVSAIPEPSGVASVAGLLTLALALASRRRRG